MLLEYKTRDMCLSRYICVEAAQAEVNIDLDHSYSPSTHVSCQMESAKEDGNVNAFRSRSGRTMVAPSLDEAPCSSCLPSLRQVGAALRLSLLCRDALEGLESEVCLLLTTTYSSSPKLVDCLFQNPKNPDQRGYMSPDRFPLVHSQC